jgi:hypothetical protein
VAKKTIERDDQEGYFMLKKISGLARALYILLAIVTAFVALGMMNATLVLLALGLIAGISMPRERMVLTAAIVIALPTIGAALGNVPTIGAQLAAMATNLQVGAAGALASALAIFLYELVMDGLTGVMGGGRLATATAR